MNSLRYFLMVVATAIILSQMFPLLVLAGDNLHGGPP
jgi:hypothetical protein